MRYDYDLPDPNVEIAMIIAGLGAVTIFVLVVAFIGSIFMPDVAPTHRIVPIASSSATPTKQICQCTCREAICE